jgi:hypothetical protein
MEITSNELENITPSCKLINSNSINVNKDYPEICTRKYDVKNVGHAEIRFVKCKGHPITGHEGPRGGVEV